MKEYSKYISQRKRSLAKRIKRASKEITYIGSLPPKNVILEELKREKSILFFDDIGRGYQQEKEHDWLTDLLIDDLFHHIRNIKVERIKAKRINQKIDFFVFDLENKQACDEYLRLKKNKLLSYGIGFGGYKKRSGELSEQIIELGLESYVEKPLDPKEDFIDEIKSLIKINNNIFKNQGFTILGPSGVGKNTLIDNLLQYHKRAGLCTKLTTRPLRRKDKGIKQVTEKKFMKLANNKKLVGINEYDNNFYGYLHNEIESYKNFGMDVFIDTTSPEVATNLKKEFPNFFKTITLEKIDKKATINLITRFEKFDQQNSYLDYLKNSLKNRINYLMKKDKDYDKMIEIADFVLEDDNFGFKNNEFRRYINYSRNNLLHPKDITLTNRYNQFHGRSTNLSYKVGSS